MRIVILLFVSLVMFGCASTPSRQQQMDAYYGNIPDDAEKVIREFMSSQLKDPMSATYRLQGFPQQGWAGGGLHGGFKYGWRICAGINAKNSFGGYVGERMYFFLIQDDKVIHFLDASYTQICR